METRKYLITLSEPMLGSKPSDAEIYTSFVAAKKADALPKDEVSAAQRAEMEIDALEKGMTIFHRDESGNPIIWDYQIRGFFKSACGSLRRDASSKSAALKAYKSIIDGNVFVGPRRIAMTLPTGGKIDVLERPLRAQTPQGERVALAKSETVPAGTSFAVEVTSLAVPWTVIEEWLDYGALRGIGQWRNASYGRFEWKRIEG